MRIEYLYPDLGNLFGDSANIKYLMLCVPNAELIRTRPGETPAFSDGADFVCLGPMTERGQKIAAAALAPWAEALMKRVDEGTHFLFTGNSMEILGKEFRSANAITPGLGLLDMRSETDLKARYNGFFLGEADGITITAFNSRFSHSYPGGDTDGFAAVKRGIGINPGALSEGVRLKNLIGTYLLGPLLPLNPDWTKKLLSSLGTDADPVFYTEAKEAYEKRLAEFSDPRRKLD